MGRVMSDATLAAHARRYKEAKAHAKAADAEADVIRDAILDELERRKVATGQQLELKGVRIAKKSRGTKVYSIAKLRKSIARTLHDKVFRTEVNAGVLAELVKAGAVDEGKVNSALERTDYSAPYIDVTLQDAA